MFPLFRCLLYKSPLYSEALVVIWNGRLNIWFIPLFKCPVMSVIQAMIWITTSFVHYPKTGHVRFSNGWEQIGLEMFPFSNGIKKPGPKRPDFEWLSFWSKPNTIENLNTHCKMEFRTLSLFWIINKDVKLGWVTRVVFTERSL